MRELAGCPETKKVVEVTSGWRRVIWAAGSGSAGREVDQAQCVGMLEDLWMVGAVQLAKPSCLAMHSALKGALYGEDCGWMELHPGRLSKENWR